MTTNNLVTLVDGTAYAIAEKNISAKDVIVQNVGNSTVYLGDSGVSHTNYGLKLGAGIGLSISLGYYDELYAITNGANSQISVLTVGGK